MFPQVCYGYITIPGSFASILGPGFFIFHLKNYYGYTPPLFSLPLLSTSRPPHLSPPLFLPSSQAAALTHHSPSHLFFPFWAFLPDSPACSFSLPSIFSPPEVMHVTSFLITCNISFPSLIHSHITFCAHREMTSKFQPGPYPSVLSHTSFVRFSVWGPW